MIFRLLNPQGIAGIVAGLALAILLLIQKGETRHWQKQSSQFEKLHAQEQAAFAETVSNYRAATEQARQADLANLQRVAAEQRAINERTNDEYQERLAAAHALAERLRRQASGAPADPGSGGAAAVPAISAAAGAIAQGAGQDRLPEPDRLLATEQAIQLDELIKWIRRQATVDANGSR